MTISEAKHKPCQHTPRIWGHNPGSCLPSWSDLWTQLDAKEYVISVIPTLANTSLKQQSILHQPLSCWIDEHPPCAHRARELGPLLRSFSCLLYVMLCYQAVHKNTEWHTLSFHVCSKYRLIDHLHCLLCSWSLDQVSKSMTLLWHYCVVQPSVGGCCHPVYKSIISSVCITWAHNVLQCSFSFMLQ